MDLSLSPRAEQWRAAIRTFIDEVVIPLESTVLPDCLTDDVRRQLQQAARDAGIWAPQAAAALGGGGFRFDEAAMLLEEAGRSLLGPLALNCAAPDEGNIHLLDVVATSEQHERFLAPLVAGEVRSCFAMTEPAPGAGSDPAALRTTAVRIDGGWRINGRKHLITGADGAAFSIVMAGNEDTGGATMFLVPTDTPGWHLAGHAKTLDRGMVGGHCTIELDNVEVPDDAVLGEVGEGFRYAQVRLAPARLTHCMRWLGAAQRAHEIALAHTTSRELFGERLSSLGMAQAHIADNEIDLAAARSLLHRACWQIEQGDRSTEASSIAKVFVSEAVWRVVDRSVQLCGGLGTTEDWIVGRIFADARAFRIYDGASEAHRMSIARRASRRAAAPSSAVEQ